MLPPRRGALPCVFLRSAAESLRQPDFFYPISPSPLGDIAGARAPKEHRGRSPGGLGVQAPCLGAP